MTVRDRITMALKLLGVLGPGEAASAEDAADALVIYQSMVDQWAAESLTIPRELRTVVTIVANQPSYSVGPTGNIAITRPAFITGAAMIDLTDASNPTEIDRMDPMTFAEWRNIPQKSLTATIATACFYDPTEPTGTLYLWPIPNTSARTMALYSPAAMATPATLSDVLVLQQGYQRAIDYNLALALIPLFPRQVPEMLALIAQESKAALERVNAVNQMTELRADPALLGPSHDELITAFGITTA